MSLNKTKEDTGETGIQRRKYAEEGCIRLLETMFRIYRNELIQARDHLILCREAGYRSEVQHLQGELREILAAFGFYGFEVEPIMKAYRIDRAMLGMEKG